MKRKPAGKPRIVFRCPDTPAALDAAREILREYARSPDVDLCFQNFEAEHPACPCDYTVPAAPFLPALGAGHPPRSS